MIYNTYQKVYEGKETFFQEINDATIPKPTAHGVTLDDYRDQDIFNPSLISNSMP